MVHKKSRQKTIGNSDKKSYCTLYIVRHGETDWNLQERMQGQIDIPLNETGIKQAKILAKKLKNIKFEMVFSSDLLRAKRTAEIIALEHKLAVKTTKALRERTFGKYEGINYKEYHKLFEQFFRKSYNERYSKKAYDNTESNEELMLRFIPIIRELSVAYPGKNILVVTHGGVMRAFLHHLSIVQKTEYRRARIANTAYMILESDGSDFFINDSYGINTE